MTDAPIEISVVVPFFNEERGVAALFERLLPVLRELKRSFEVVCVNDGSSDATLAALLGQRSRESAVVVIDLTRNFGKEAALTAGIDQARGRAVIVMDADLQDPPELIRDLVSHWERGSEMVLAHRADRSSDTFAKRTTAGLFYRMFNRVSDTPIPADVGDMRLLDRAVVDVIKALPERQRFMKGLFAWAGFRTATVDYTRDARSKGEAKFGFWRLWNLALEGVTSFSTLPLRVWTYLGMLVSISSFLYAAFLIARTLIHGVVTPGYASTLVVVLFLGGLQMMGTGLLGEYVGRTYLEAKRRPIYVVRTVHR